MSAYRVAAAKSRLNRAKAMPDIKIVYDYYLSCSDHTTKDRDKYAFNRLSPFFNQTNVLTIKRADLRQYVQHRRFQDVSDSTINRELRSFRAALNFYTTDHSIKFFNPLSGFSLRDADPLTRYLTQHQARALLVACAQSENPYLEWFVRLALATGFRSGQILGLAWAQLDHTQGFVIFKSQQHKGRKLLQLPLNVQALETIDRIKQHQAKQAIGTAWVFPSDFDPTKHTLSLKKSFSNARERVGLDWLRIHDLRHTFASWLVQSGTPLYTVSKLMGHSSIESTQRYAHLDSEHLRAALNQLPMI